MQNAINVPTRESTSLCRMTQLAIHVPTDGAQTALRHPADHYAIFLHRSILTPRSEAAEFVIWHSIIEGRLAVRRLIAQTAHRRLPATKDYLQQNPTKHRWRKRTDIIIFLARRHGQLT